MMTCQGRIPGKTFTIPGTTNQASKPRECGKALHTRVPVDDGEAELPLCLACFKRYEKRENPVVPWLGFFDCDYPPQARIVGSAWYRKMVEQGVSTLTTGISAIKIDATGQS